MRPNLYLDSIGAFSVEVSQRKVLFQLLEKQLYLPSFPVYVHNVLSVRLHVIGQQGDKLRPRLLDVGICDNPGMMDDDIPLAGLLGERDVLHAVGHPPIVILVHDVLLDGVFEVLLQLRHIYDPILCQLLELAVVDICPVHCHDIPFGVLRGLKHEAVVCGSRRELNVGRHTLIGVYNRVGLDPALLPPCPGAPADTLEDKVGEQ